MQIWFQLQNTINYITLFFFFLQKSSTQHFIVWMRQSQKDNFHYLIFSSMDKHHLFNEIKDLY